MSTIELDRLATDQPTPDTPPANPWPGLASYTEEQQDLFFGREREAAELLRLIGRETLTVLFGRSGLGKTSLLRAAVIPRLREQGYFPIILRLDYSGSGSPPVEQAKALVLAAARSSAIDIENQPPENGRGTLWEFFHTIEFWGPRNDRLTPILIFDQFEEVFTIGRSVKQASDFLEQLADLVENRIPRAVEERIEKSKERFHIGSASDAYKVLLSLREDFVPKLDSLRGILPAIMRNRLALNPLDCDRALEVITRAGRAWVSENVARMIIAALAGQQELRGDFSGAGSAAEIEPAYLSVMCHELFRRMVALDRPAITSDLVEQEHGGILERLYERSFEGLEPKVRLFVEDRLLTASGFRGTVPVAEALGEGVSISDLDKLVDRRLLRFEDRLGTLHVELSHDLLTRVVRNSRDQRHVREEQAKLHRDLVRFRTRAALAGAAAVLLSGALVFLYLAYWRTNVRYSSDFVKRFGEVEPSGAVRRGGPDPHRAVSMKFTRRGLFGPTLSMQAVDSSGNLTTRHNVGTYLTQSDQEQTEREKECQWNFIYDSHHRVVYEIALDQSNRMVYGIVYSPTGNAKHDLIRKAMFVGPDGYPEPQLKTRAEYIEIHYDSAGNEINRFFTDRQGNPAPGPDEAYGRKFEYDRQGRPIKEISLDAEHRPMNDDFGNATLVSEYDAAGNEASGTALDASGKITLGRDGWAETTYRHDQWGNTTEIHYLDEYLRPVLDRDSGAYVWKNTYDTRGNRIEERAFEGDGSTPMITEPDSSSTIRYHLWKTAYDSANRAVAYSVFDASDKPMLTSDGWHQLRLVRDQNGFVTERDYFDRNDHPANGTDGFQKILRKPDDYGEPVELRYFDANGAPALTRDGHFHIWRRVYDKRGNLVQSSVYGRAGEPVLDVSIGAHKYTTTYDRFNNPIQTEYYGVDGRPTLCLDGYFAKVETYDLTTGRLASDQFLGLDGHLVRGPEGVARQEYEYSPEGMMKETRNSGVDGKPAEDTAGVWRTTREHNAKRLLTKIQFFGLDNKPAANKDGVHLQVTEYTAAGREIRFAQFGKNAEGAFDPALGIAETRRTYDAQGNLTQTYHASDGSLRNLAAGYAIHRVISDSHGHVIEESYFDQNRRLTYGPGGYCKWERRGNSVWVDGKLYVSEERAKDDLNRTAVPLVFISGITRNSVAENIGLRETDVLWKLGTFYHPQSLERNRGKAADSDELYNVILAEFKKGRDVGAKNSSVLTVLRQGKPVHLRVPPLAGKPLGIQVQSRLVPYAYYQTTIVKAAAMPQ